MSKSQIFFFITDSGNDDTARPDDCDAPYRTMSAIMAYCAEHEITNIVLMEWRLDRWHQVGG